MDITVTDAQLVARPGAPAVWMLAVEVTRDGVTRRLAHSLPPDTLGWRSAEYGIDDPDELLAMALLEPYLDREDPVEHPDSLVNAETTVQARDHHRGRIQAARGAGRLRDRNRRPSETRPAPATARVLADNDLVPDTPLVQLRREMAPDPERVAVMREHVQRTRAAARARIAAAGSVEQWRARPDAEQLRAQLAQHPHGS